MYNNDAYKNKYLKWKSKYLHLRGGANTVSVVIDENKSFQEVINGVEKTFSIKTRGLTALASHVYVIEIKKSIIMKSFEQQQQCAYGIMNIIQNCMDWNTFLFSKVFRTKISKRTNGQPDKQTASDGIFVTLDMFPVKYLPIIIKFICLLVQSIICWIVQVIVTKRTIPMAMTNVKHREINDLMQKNDDTNLDQILKLLIEWYADITREQSSMDPTDINEDIRKNNMIKYTYGTNSSNNVEYYILNAKCSYLHQKYLTNPPIFLNTIKMFDMDSNKSNSNLPNISKLAENTEKIYGIYKKTETEYNYWVNRYVYIEIPKLLDDQISKINNGGEEINLDKIYSEINKYDPEWDYKWTTTHGCYDATWICEYYEESKLAKICELSGINKNILTSIQNAYKEIYKHFTEDALKEVIQSYISIPTNPDPSIVPYKPPTKVEMTREMYNRILKNLFYYAVDVYFNRTFPLYPRVNYTCTIHVSEEVFTHLSNNTKKADAFLHNIDKHDFLQVGSTIKYICDQGNQQTERTIKQKITYDGLASLIKVHHNQLCLDFSKFDQNTTSIIKTSLNNDAPNTATADINALMKQGDYCIGWLLGNNHPHCPHRPGTRHYQTCRTHNGEGNSIRYNWDHSFKNYKSKDAPIDDLNGRMMVNFDEPTFVVIFEDESTIPVMC